MPPAIPIATYRLQLTGDFDFDAAAQVAPYLKALGISHVYASPFMKARKGSSHGYDVVDHTKFNPELGGEEGFARFSDALKRNDLGLILDFVPNHVGVHFADNPWWLDVLEWGPQSPHAVSFDIDWDQLPYRARGGVLLPILGSSYGLALERGEIGASDLDHAIGLMTKHRALEDTISRAQHYGAMAVDALALFPPSPMKTALEQVVAFCLARSH